MTEDDRNVQKYPASRTLEPPIPTPRAPASQEGVIDAMGVTSRAEELGQNHEQFLGNSSAASFLRQIQGEYSRSGTSPRTVESNGTPGSKSAKVTPQIVNPVNGRDAEDYVLPSREQADRLLQCYWSRQHALYPFIHKPTFTAAYDRLWAASETSDNEILQMGLGDASNSPDVFFSALNAMFALACQTIDVMSSERETEADVFFQRSKILIQRIDVFEKGDLSLIQALLVNAHYLQSTQLADRCWNVIGLACRLAQSIGLHSTEHDDQWSFAELQMRRRTWYGCIMLDLSAGMALGRPPMTYWNSKVPLPQAIDDEFLIGLSQQPHGTISSTAFFNYNMELFRILGEILRKVYKPDLEAERMQQGEPGNFDNRIARAIVDIDLSLARFSSSLPEALRYDGTNQSSCVENTLHRQSVILQARVYHLKIILYRPMLVRLRSASRNRTANRLFAVDAEISNNDDLTRSDFGVNCTVKCVESAMALIELLDGSAQVHRPAWWYCVLYLFTSGVVLILAELCPDITEKVSRSSLLACWGKCLVCLDSTAVYTNSAKKCATDLRKTYSLIFPDQQQGLAENQPNDQPFDDAYPDLPLLSDELFMADFTWDDHGLTMPFYF
ncbi:hypothetical protein BO71DRAFT_145754 [Aspergillus ellipticus CBS 707.79]|uniref:Xylanolytic transcriptional activator regulatory domain-containing protein n=1 Tax=Aspergillus ellipticus CBS 707.79 TaxID=1448320 RepID=A0A319DHZ0_9EURO|nr:hypothetical protein BO71DRAFT_145754 [Aspergillus ellipticus CBS 707.79]